MNDDSGTYSIDLEEILEIEEDFFLLVTRDEEDQVRFKVRGS